MPRAMELVSHAVTEEENSLNDMLAKASLNEPKQSKEELAKQPQAFPIEIIKTAT
jgi:hypothetical protein